MGQVNMSLSDETKACLMRIQERYHYSSISETVSRLAWQAEENLDRQQSDVFDAIKLQCSINNIVARFARAFKEDNVFSAEDLARCVQTNVFRVYGPDNKTLFSDIKFDERSVMIWSAKDNRLCMLDVCNETTVLDVINECGRSWAGSPDVTTLTLDDGRVRFEPILRNIDKNRFGESMPASTGLSFTAPVGFSIVRYASADSRECLDRIDYIWDDEHKAFMIRF